MRIIGSTSSFSSSRGGYITGRFGVSGERGPSRVGSGLNRIETCVGLGSGTESKPVLGAVLALMGGQAGLGMQAN